MSDPMTEVVARVRASREHWCQLDARLAVKFRRPTLEQRSRILQLQGGERMRAVLALVCDWRGFTEADVLPGGGDEPLPFDVELWQLVVDERDDWQEAIVRAMNAAREAHDKAAAHARGN